jgi:hypothetical protein
MKKISFRFIALAIIFLACSKKSDSPVVISTTTVTNTVSSGNWRITYYWDTDHEETSGFSGYSFTFGTGNSLTASKPGTVVTGTWTTLLDDSKTKLVLSFSAPASFVELSDDWHVIERTDNKIRLQDVSGGNSLLLLTD